jgi:hypothetical protein
MKRLWSVGCVVGWVAVFGLVAGSGILLFLSEQNHPVDFMFLNFCLVKFSHSSRTISDFDHNSVIESGIGFLMIKVY